MPTSIMSAPPSTSASSRRALVVEIGIAEHDERAERALAALRAAARTSRRSGSCRRPQQLLRLARHPCRRGPTGRRAGSRPARSSASFSAWASACADSNAQRMPSLRRQRLERGERFGVGRADIFGAAAVLEVRMLGADRGIIEPGRDRPAVGDLPVFVLQHIGLGAVEDAGPAAQQGRAMLGAVEPLARRLDADQRAPSSSMKSENRPIAFDPPPTQAITASGRRPELLEHLRPRLLADHPLELAHHQREGVRPGGGAEQIMRVGEACRPVAQRLVDRVLERPRRRLSPAPPRRPSAASGRR